MAVVDGPASVGAYAAGAESAATISKARITNGLMALGASANES